MTVSSLSIEYFHRLVSTSGVFLHIGPYIVKLKSSIKDVATGTYLHYKDYLLADSDFADFHVSIDPPSNLRRWLKPQVNFSLDGKIPFKPLPREQAFPLFEWGLNWCVSAHSNQYLVVHAAAVEKYGQAILMPAPPGYGKSTLCAGLVARGWRLLTDELTLIPVNDHTSVVSLPRPISLKNESIDVMRVFAPNEVIGPVASDTAKGTVAHMRAPQDSVKRCHELAKPSLIIFPQFRPQIKTLFNQRTRARTFMEIAQQSFNFNILAEKGFDLLNQLVTGCDCFDLAYSDLEEAVELLDQTLMEKAGLSERRIKSHG